MTAPVVFPLAGRRVWVAGHRGLVGSALLRRLAGEPCEVLTVGRREVDLRRQAETEAWVDAHRPDVVILAAATVGGIFDNARRPADYLHDNLAIAQTVMHAAARAGVAKLLFLGSSCIYPRGAAEPITPDALLTGPLEETNAAYALAKIAGVRLAEAMRRQHGHDFISAMPCNLYGPGDRDDPERSHVLAALIRKAAEARAAGREDLEIWGTGTPRREFLHADDLADALVFLIERYSDAAPVNIGAGRDVSILELAGLVMRAAGLRGRVLHDRTKPDGVPSKLIDSGPVRAMGWAPGVALEDGVAALLRETAAA